LWRHISLELTLDLIIRKYLKLNPDNRLLNQLPKNQKEYMKQALEDTKQLIGEQDKKIAIRAPKLHE
jgi:hypothetical protein